MLSEISRLDGGSHGQAFFFKGNKNPKQGLCLGKHAKGLEGLGVGHFGGRIAQANEGAMAQ